MSGSLWTGPVNEPRRYRVELGADGPVAEPGSGGDGLLYRAWSAYGTADGVERQVALKVKLHFQVPEPDVLARRAGILAMLDDEHLMKVVEAFAGCALNDDDDDDHDPDDFDLCWVVSEWVEGTRLDALGSTPTESLRLVAQLARGVQAMHDTCSPLAPHGIVHRDIKSANVLVSDDGRAVLIDYGSAGPLHDVWVPDGTASWLSPEVAAGHEAGIAADNWGVGAVAHTLITGSPPLLDGAACSRERLLLAFGAHEHAVRRPAALADHLAALLETDPARRPQNLRTWADQLDALLTDRRRRVVALVAAAAVITLAVIVGVAIGTNDAAVATPSRRGASVTTVAGRTPPCSHELPGAAPSELIAAATALGPDTCAAGTLEHLAMATIAPLTTTDGTPSDVLLVSPGQPVLRLTSAEYASYREIAGKAQPENAVTFGGYPTGVRTVSNPDGVVMELTSGGLVIGRRTDTQMFWIPQQARATWEGTGGRSGTLGFPTSNVFLSGGELRLEFEHGYFTAKLDESQAGASTWLPFDISTVRSVQVDDPGADLRPLGDLRGHSLRQAGGTVWFVDGHLVRHWVPDGGTYDCLDAKGNQLGGDIPGYSVATLELGPPATCDTK